MRLEKVRRAAVDMAVEVSMKWSNKELKEYQSARESGDSSNFSPIRQRSNFDHALRSSSHLFPT